MMNMPNVTNSIGGKSIGVPTSSAIFGIVLCRVSTSSFDIVHGIYTETLGLDRLGLGS